MEENISATGEPGCQEKQPAVNLLYPDNNSHSFDDSAFATTGTSITETGAQTNNKLPSTTSISSLFMCCSSASHASTALEITIDDDDDSILLENSSFGTDPNIKWEPFSDQSNSPSKNQNPRNNDSSAPQSSSQIDEKSRSLDDADAMLPYLSSDALLLQQVRKAAIVTGEIKKYGIMKSRSMESRPPIVFDPTSV